MPRFRPDIHEIDPYRPGLQAGDLARRFGLTEIARLASNECPYPPFPEVQAAIGAAAEAVHRYPDYHQHQLRAALSEHLEVHPDRLWFGGGSNELILTTALAVGGPGTSAVYAWPSFGLYRIASRIAGTAVVEVPLDEVLRHDLGAMAAVVRGDTTIVYVCNPNNPTGTYVSAEGLLDFVTSLPQETLVVVDEAYMEFATAVDCSTMLQLALSRENVLVARTFSKAYGLAALRVGYMVGDPGVIETLRRIQLPFTVGTVAEVAAAEAIRHQDRLSARVEQNAAGRKLFVDELTARDIEFADSQTNFLCMRAPEGEAGEFSERLLRCGVVVRPQQKGWIRVTIGTDAENQAFFAALDSVA